MEARNRIADGITRHRYALLVYKRLLPVLDVGSLSICSPGSNSLQAEGRRHWGESETNRSERQNIAQTGNQEGRCNNLLCVRENPDGLLSDRWAERGQWADLRQGPRRMCKRRMWRRFNNDRRSG